MARKPQRLGQLDSNNPWVQLAMAVANVVLDRHNVTSTKKKVRKKRRIKKIPKDRHKLHCDILESKRLLDQAILDGDDKAIVLQEQRLRSLVAVMNTEDSNGKEEAYN